MKFLVGNVILGIIEMAFLIVSVAAMYYGDYAQSAAFVGFAIYCGASKS
jgi:hypothetical protein